jgi:HYDIN/CFA65/VesB-like, Ig-like domain
VRRRAVVLGLLVAALVAGFVGAEEAGKGAPQIRIEPESFDFGKALQGKTLRKEFTIRNFGDRDLVLEGVSTTCGCTAALPKETTIGPGGQTPLAVTLETRSYSGRVERRVLVRSNDPRNPRVEIRVSVTVEASGK